MPTSPPSVLRRAHFLPDALMLPFSPKPSHKSSDADFHHHPLPHRRRGPLCFLQIYVYPNPLAWLLLAAALFLPAALFLLLLRPASLLTFTLPFPAAPTTTPQSCHLPGRFFVYHLPSIFNKGLSDGCHTLNPFVSRCVALSNHGFGPRVVGDDLARLLPPEILPAWHWTDQFAGEIIFHRRMLWHPCRTTDASAASAFFVPFYGGLAIEKYLWKNCSAEERDFHSRKLLDWLAEQEPWRRSNGTDHFMVLGRITWDFRRSLDGAWGANLLFMEEMRNVTRLLIERDPWDPYDVGVPYPTDFHPRSPADVAIWQRFVLRRRRPTLFCFAGATRSAFRNDFRALLLSQCAAAGPPRCRAVDCSGGRCGNGSAAALDLFLGSEFCLQPRGDSHTRRSTFDCMVAGAVPVFFWTRTAYEQYPWHLSGDPTEWSVFIDRSQVEGNATALLATLEGVTPERRRRMRERIVEMLPGLVYASPKEGLPGLADAVDVAVEGVLRRFQGTKKKEKSNSRYNWYTIQ